MNYCMIVIEIEAVINSPDLDQSYISATDFEEQLLAEDCLNLPNHLG